MQTSFFNSPSRAFSLIRILASAALLMLAALPLQASADEAGQLIARAGTTLRHFQDDPDMKWYRRDLAQARAVLITPKIVKAGFIFGGAGGRAVLFARDRQTGEWRGPVFYTLGTPSIGFQAGVEVSETVTLVMNERALDRLLSDSLKLGGDVSIAAGPVGAGADSNVQADMITYARSKGLFGGVSLNGSVVKINDRWNAHLYGHGTTPSDVLVRGSAVSERGGRVRGMLPAPAPAAQ